MTRSAMFVACVGTVHAGVVMDVLSGGDTRGTARVVLRSTLTGDVFRVPPTAVVVFTTTDRPEPIECDCDLFYEGDLR